MHVDAGLLGQRKYKCWSKSNLKLNFIYIRIYACNFSWGRTKKRCFRTEYANEELWSQVNQISHVNALGQQLHVCHQRNNNNNPQYLTYHADYQRWLSPNISALSI